MSVSLGTPSHFLFCLRGSLRGKFYLVKLLHQLSLLTPAVTNSFYRPAVQSRQDVGCVDSFALVSPIFTTPPPRDGTNRLVVKGC